MKRSSEGKITAICQGGDDEPTCVSKVLIAVVKLRIYCSNNHIVFPVVPEWNDTLFVKWHEGQKNKTKGKPQLQLDFINRILYTKAAMSWKAADC